jgi:NitT/TauT family transport system substrate-binding protein
MGIDAVQQAVLSGAIDGGTVLAPGLNQVLARDPRLKVLADEKVMFPFPQGLGVAVSGAFLRAPPDAVVELIRLIRRADDLCAAHPDQAAAFVQKVLGGGLLDTSVVAQALASLTYEMDPRKAAVATQSALAYQVEIGDFDKAPPTDGLFDPSFYDRALASPAPAK